MMKDKLKILYVDDEIINLQLFKAIFENKFLIYTANSAVVGLEILEKYSDIDVVISDMKMPVINGVEFIKKAKAKFSNILFFILTGFEITEEIQAAINEGLIIKYLSKPFNISEIEKSIYGKLNLDN